ncbi:12296_t:CDS:2, partial [Rhizophagus irregularis]
VYKYPSLTLIKSSQEKSLNDETSVILREEQEENWVMVKQCRGRGDVKNGKNAIYDSAYDKHGFGDGDLRIFDKVCDLKEYEKRIIKNDSFEIEDYE